MLDSCIKVILNRVIFAPKENGLTFHSEVCHLLVYYYSVVHMYFFLTIPMIVASSNIQLKVLKVGKLWAGERTACAVAGLGERKAGAEQEERELLAPAFLAPFAQRWVLDLTVSILRCQLQCQGWGELCWAEDVLLHPICYSVILIC